MIVHLVLTRNRHSTGGSKDTLATDTGSSTTCPAGSEGVAAAWAADVKVRRLTPNFVESPERRVPTQGDTLDSLTDRIATLSVSASVSAAYEPVQAASPSRSEDADDEPSIGSPEVRIPQQNE